MNRITPLLLFFVVACDCGGTTELTACMSEAECAVGEQCVDMVCLQSGCAEDGECPVNFACLDTLCVPGGDACMGDEMCSGGQVCVDDRCQAAVCVDPDMDGFGPGCPRGADCDPDDRLQTGQEICDGRDNDCDGEADNGVLSPCGDCNPDCMLGGLGPMTMPFMPDEMNSDGVGVNPDGALELDARSINTNFIWIANTPEGSVSRFSTTPPYNEVGRYFTDVDPSRTSVNSVGDAFVGNRRGGSITRISVLGEDCPDTNGDGVVTTSSDLNGDGVISIVPADGEMLAFGEDDCLLWRTDDVLGADENLIRAVAAQDVEGPDGELQEYVWVGGYNTNTLAKLDARDGSVILTTPAPRAPYGFALDGTGKLWVSTRSGNFLGFVDTNRCVDNASCDVAVCQAGSAEGTECDGEIKATIPAPFTLYGVTVDFNQRVWVGGGGIARFDITAAAGSRWGVASLPFTGSLAIHGIAADAEGFVWGAGQSNGVVRVDADTLENTVVAGTTGASNKGMAIDFEGKIWSITQSPQAIVITPGPTLMENVVETGVASSIASPYTYSDMTGLQLRLATNPRGYYRHVFEGCPDGSPTTWNEIRFDADTPAGTSVSFRVRTAATRDALDAAMWVQVGVAPPETSPLDIASALMDAGIDPERFLMIEIVLTAERMSTTEIITPRVSTTDVTHICPPILG